LVIGVPAGSATLFDSLDEPLTADGTIATDLADQVSAAIGVVQDQRFVYANAALAAHFGYPSAQALVGMELGAFVSRHVAGEFQDETLAWLTIDGTTVRCQRHDLRRLDRATLTAECTATPIRFAGKRALACVWHDSAAEERAQAHAARTERLASLAKLAAGVAHEINNPLAYMAVNLDLALEELKSLRSASAQNLAADRLADIELALTDVRDGVRRVGRTVDDLNTLVLAGRSNATAVDVRVALESALTSLERRLPPDTRVVRAYLDVPKVRGSELWLTRALYEVLHNAVLALGRTQTERVLRLAISPVASDVVRVCIEDSGPGIGCESLSRVFDPYFTTRSCGSGAGLGLSVAHTIVTSLGGSIEVESEPGARTRATLQLPVSG
jgi:signal transduction histidine kinase